MAKRGRPLSVASLVGRLKSGTVAKERLLTNLENLAGTLSIGEACRRLHLARTPFRRLRKAALLAGLRATEPRPRGRPVRETPRHQLQIAKLEEKISALEEDLAVSRVREELAFLVPWAGRRQKKIRKTRVSGSGLAPSPSPNGSGARENPGPGLRPSSA